MKNNLILILCSILTGIIISKLFIFKESSTDHNIAYCESQSSEYKQCPKKLGHIFLPRNYQAKSINIAYSNDRDHLKFLDLILQKVKALSPRPIVNVLIARNEIEDARIYFHDKYKVENRSFLNYIPTPSNETIWQQDYYELLLNTSTGLTSIVDLPYPDREGEDIPSALSLYCKKELIEQAKEFSNDYPPGNGDYGGNIEAFSEKIVAVGNNMTFETMDKIKSITSQVVLELNVEWLLTGHVDELFSLIPHSKNANACDQTLLYASPAKAVELLVSNIGSTIDYPYYEKNPFLDDQYWPNYEYCLNDANLKSSPCKAFYQSNNDYQKIQEQNIAIIQKAFEELHKCRLKTLSIPQLFAPKKFDSKRYGTVDDMAVSLNNNSVNNILFYPHLFLPKQRIKFFQTYIEEALKDFGVDTNYIEGNFVHSLSGGIHCATNISYGCRP